eukprot:SAG31_NODE_1392_length_8533_cov_3.382974_2_plen_818_part_00
MTYSDGVQHQLSPADGLLYNQSTAFVSVSALGDATLGVAFADQTIEITVVMQSGVHTITLISQETDVLGTEMIEERLVQHVRECFENLRVGRAASVDTAALCDALQLWKSDSGMTFLEYSIRSQNDACEFLGKVIDTMADEMGGTPAAERLRAALTNKSIVFKRCHSCQCVTRGREEGRILMPVPIESVEQRWGSLEQALEHMVQSEVMTGENAVMCDTCTTRETTSYTTAVSTLPPVLLIQLQRFKQDMYGNFTKSNHRVTFPDTLDMWPYTCEARASELDRNVERTRCLYKLVGVVLHSGSHRAGHYTSLAQHRSKWYTFNDQHVSAFEDDFDEVCFGGEAEDSARHGNGPRENNKNAYILIYRAQETKHGDPSWELSETDDIDWAIGQSVNPSTRKVHDAGVELMRQQLLFDSSVLDTLRTLVATAREDEQQFRQAFEMGVRIFSNVVCHARRHHDTVETWVTALKDKMCAIRCTSAWLLVQIHQESDLSIHFVLTAPSKCRSSRTRDAIIAVLDTAISVHKSDMADAAPPDSAPHTTQIASVGLAFCEKHLPALKQHADPSRNPVPPPLSRQDTAIGDAPTTEATPAAPTKDAGCGESVSATAEGVWRVTIKNSESTAMTVCSGHSVGTRRFRTTIASGGSYTWEAETERDWHGEVSGRGEYAWRCRGSGYQNFTVSNYAGFSSHRTTISQQTQQQPALPPIDEATPQEQKPINSAMVDQCCEICGCSREEVVSSSLASCVPCDCVLRETAILWTPYSVSHWQMCALAGTTCTAVDNHTFQRAFHRRSDRSFACTCAVNRRMVTHCGCSTFCC